MNQYLVPANSKKSQLIFGLFIIKDLVVFAIGLVLTILMTLVLKNPTTMELLLAITPVGIAALLIFPIAHYHNVMKLISNILMFFIGRRKYYWKGWCVKDD